MLVNFGVDPDAIDDSTNGYHVRALRSKWQQFGILVHPSHDDGSLSLISRKFPSLRQEVQTLWADAWQEIRNDPVRYLRCRGDFSLALVSEARARSRRIPNGDSIYLDSDSLGAVEWIRLTEVNASREFERAETLSRSPISRMETVERLWQQRFQSLAKFSHEIVIIDRNAPMQGFTNLLEFIDRDAANCEVTIYSSLENSELAEFQTRSLAFENIGALTVYLPYNHQFGREGRDRFIRFDKRAFSLGHGITEVFRSSTVLTGTTFGPTELQYMHDLEKYLKDNTMPENVIHASQSPPIV